MTRSWDFLSQYWRFYQYINNDYRAEMYTNVINTTGYAPRYAISAKIATIHQNEVCAISFKFLKKSQRILYSKGA